MNNNEIKKRLEQCISIIESAEEYLKEADKVLEKLTSDYMSVVTIHEEAVKRLEELEKATRPAKIKPLAINIQMMRPNPKSKPS